MGQQAVLPLLTKAHPPVAHKLGHDCSAQRVNAVQCLVAIIVAAACPSSSAHNASGGKTYTIGVLKNLSGPAAVGASPTVQQRLDAMGIAATGAVRRSDRGT